MNEASYTRLWAYRGGFVFLCLIILFGQLLPMQFQTRNWAGPDLILCLALCWSVRRPDFVPLAMLALVFLLADFLLQRPPGLWSALALLACAQLQSRARNLRVSGFAEEWLRISLLIFGIALLWRVALIATLVPVPRLGLNIIQMLMTILAYPIIYGLSRTIDDLRLGPSSEFDSHGARL